LLLVVEIEALGVLAAMFHVAHDIIERWLLKTSSSYLNLIAAQQHFDPQDVCEFDDAFFPFRAEHDSTSNTFSPHSESGS
jgi:hypothetical protein